MALVVKDRVQETTTTEGTGTLTLSGAVTGFQTFSSAIGNSNTTYYAISSNGSEFEVGIGTVGAGTLARTTILASSNGGSVVDLSAGTKNVFCTYPAGRSIYLNSAASEVVVSKNNTDTSITTDGTADITISTNSGSNSGTVKIFDGANGNIEITPNGTGVVKLDGLSYPTADGTASQVLKTNGSGILSFATISGGTPTVNTFDTGTAATYTKPGTANWMLVELWGGGGSGGRSTANNAAGGGGGGSYNYAMIPFADLVGNVTYTVGAGGAGVTTAVNGNAGGTTSVSFANFQGLGTTKTISAFGGGFGRGAGAGNASSNASGGGGGTQTSAGGNASSIGGGNDVGFGGFPVGDTVPVPVPCSSPTNVTTYTAVPATMGGGGGILPNPTRSITTAAGSIFGGGGGGAGLQTTGGAGGNSYYGGGGGSGNRTNTGGTSIWGGNGSNGAASGTVTANGGLPAGGSAGAQNANSGNGGGGRVRFTYW
jgi:hypothetical protein